MRHSGDGDDPGPLAVPSHWPTDWSVDPDWFADETFWELAGPALFSEERWTEAALEIPAALALLGVTPPARILDVACGPGRHLLPLARLGYHVTGVDRSAAFLREAGARASAEGLHVELVLGDLGSLSEALGPARDGFDGALWLDSSIGYGSEDADFRALEAVRALLRPGARLVIETLGRECVLGPSGAGEPPSGRELERQRVGGAEWLIERRVADGTWMEVRWGPVDGSPRSYRHRLYGGPELINALHDAKYRNILIYGDLDRATYGWEAAGLVAEAVA